MVDPMRARDPVANFMPRAKPFTLSAGALQGLFFLQKYRFLTIPQFATAADFSVDHAGELLRTLASRGLVGFLGFVPLPGQGRTPKVYYLKRKGFEYLQLESEGTADLGAFQEVNPELSWSPQMYHRIALLDLFMALERAVRARPSFVLLRTFLEYRRLPGTYTRETADYVAPEEAAANRIVPDGAFVLENLASGRRGLFFVEMDMGTERIAVSRGAGTRGQRSRASFSSTTGI